MLGDSGEGLLGQGLLKLAAADFFPFQIALGHGKRGGQAQSLCLAGVKISGIDAVGDAPDFNAPAQEKMAEPAGELILVRLPQFAGVIFAHRI